MSQVEELLNSIGEGIPAHTHPVPDTDTYFIIDPITRKIENTTRKKTVIMQYDHNSERFTFELPRYVDGHDMLECTSVTVNVDNIEAIVAEGEEPRINSDAPDMTDLRVHPTDPEKVVSSWLISRNSTQLAGNLSFHIEYKCVDSEGNVVYEWSTDSYDEITIKARKKNGEAAVAEYTDLLEQWRARIFGAGDSVIADIVAEGVSQVNAVKMESATQQEAVELKGAQTLETIPEDYVEVDAMADEAIRSKGDAIVCEVLGESIVLKDSSNDYIRGLKLFGKSTQVTTTGVQLLSQPYHDTTKESNGVKFTVNADGSITISGTSTATELASCYFTLNSGISLSGTYTYKCYGLPDNCVTNVYFIGDIVGEASKTMNLVEGNSYGFVIRVRPNANVSATVYPMLVAGDTIKPYEPYTAGSISPNPTYPQSIASTEEPNVVLYGKQLLNITTKTSNSIELKVDGDVCELTNLTTNRYGNVVFKLSLAPGVYTLAADTFDGHIVDSGHLVKLSDDDSNVYITSLSTANLSRTFVLEKYTNLKVELYAGGVTIGEKHTIRGLRIYYGESEQSWTTYIEPRSVALNYVISGIPVASGGNYTDSDGQQWVCDEIDLERGMYIANVYLLDCATDIFGVAHHSLNNDDYLVCYLTGLPRSTNKTTKVVAMSTHFPVHVGSAKLGVESCAYVYYNSVNSIHISIPATIASTKDELKQWLVDNKVKFLYPVDTPVETPLTAEEITAFKSLRTNYPNTTILNDAGAWMSVKYNADTKAYIDAPKVLKLTDSSTGVVYELKIVNGTIVANPV